jgi:hypothetical protein
MTLVELMLAIGLSVLLVGTAAFVFSQSQQIFNRVGGRLDAVQGFRVATNVLGQDCAHMVAPLPTPITNSTVTAGSSPWISITQQGSLPTSAGATNTRSDILSFVTRAQIIQQDTTQPAPAPYSATDQMVLVTYKLHPTLGFIRQLDLITSTNAGLAVNDATLPVANSPIVTQISVQATAFRVRYCNQGTGTLVDPVGTVVPATPPTAIEITVFMPEAHNANTQISLTRTIEVLAPH